MEIHIIEVSAHASDAMVHYDEKRPPQLNQNSHKLWSCVSFINS